MLLFTPGFCCQPCKQALHSHELWNRLVLLVGLAGTLCGPMLCLGSCHLTSSCLNSLLTRAVHGAALEFWCCSGKCSGVSLHPRPMRRGFCFLYYSGTAESRELTCCVLVLNPFIHILASQPCGRLRATCVIFPVPLFSLAVSVNILQRNSVGSLLVCT